MEINEYFKLIISRYQLRKKKCLLAVSGGVDSMVLAELFLINNLQFGVAHVNYNFRNEESKAEKNLVEHWCSKNKIPFFFKEIEGKELLQNQNLQAFARKVRYDFFNKILEENNFEFIVTAHHKDDQVETVLMNLFKGTGLKGLLGIKELQNNMLRPLLAIDKKNLIHYAQKNEVIYFDDSSNKENKYLRNRLRNQLIPIINEIVINATNNIYNTIVKLDDYYKISQASIDKFFKKISVGDLGSLPFKIHAKSLIDFRYSDLLLFELISSYGFNTHQINEFYKLCIAQQGAKIENEEVVAIMDKGWIVFYKNCNDEVMVINSLQDLKEDKFTPNFQLFKIGEEAANDINSLYLDADKLIFPLVISKWNQGDYFYPKGLNKKKKIAKLLIDLKIPLHQRADVKVIKSGEYIVAVINLKEDHRFAADEMSINILKIAKQS